MAGTQQKTNVTSAEVSAPVRADLSEVAARIAREVARGDEAGQKTTLRRLLKRCGYEKRNAQTVRRVAAALDAAGVQCLPPPAGVENLDDTIQLQSAAPRKKGNAAPQKAPSKNGAIAKKNGSTKTKTPKFASLEEMLLHARRATVLVKLADGHGSGLVINAAGVVLTARHVVDNSETVCLRYEDGTESEGRVLFSDTALDYAFVQGKPRDEFFTLHNGLHLSIGQSVYAVGTPMQTDLAGSVSRGIISGLDRIVGGVKYVQTDATIHAGHSGGPLLTEDGQVIGMNLWGRPEEGIRFALPLTYILEAWQVLEPQLNDLNARLYCTDCGFLNGADSWILCSSWVCCGHCGTVLGDLKASELQPDSECEKTEDEELKADRAQLKQAKSEAAL